MFIQSRFCYEWNVFAMIKYNLKLHFIAKWIFFRVCKCTEPKALIDSLDCWTFDAKNKAHRWDAAMACSYFLTSINSIYLRLALELFFSTFFNSRVSFCSSFFSYLESTSESTENTHYDWYASIPNDVTRTLTSDIFQFKAIKLLIDKSMKIIYCS